MHAHSNSRSSPAPPALSRFRKQITRLHIAPRKRAVERVDGGEALVEFRNLANFQRKRIPLLVRASPNAGR